MPIKVKRALKVAGVVGGFILYLAIASQRVEWALGSIMLMCVAGACVVTWEYFKEVDHNRDPRA